MLGNVWRKRWKTLDVVAVVVDTGNLNGEGICLFSGTLIPTESVSFDGDTGSGIVISYSTEECEPSFLECLFSGEQ